MRKADVFLFDRLVGQIAESDDGRLYAAASKELERKLGPRRVRMGPTLTSTDCPSGRMYSCWKSATRGGTSRARTSCSSTTTSRST